MRRLSLILLSLLSVTVHAEDERWFEVEIYIYQQNSPSVEQWPTLVAKPHTQNTVDLIAPVTSTDIRSVRNGLTRCTSQDWATNSNDCNAQLATNANVSTPANLPVEIAASQTATAYMGQGPVLLAKSQSQFGDIMKKIARRRGNTSLLHMTWQQAMKPRNQATPLHIYAGHDFEGAYEYDGQPINMAQDNGNIPRFDFMQGMYNDTANGPVWQLDGTLNIYLNHYLYIEAALNLREKGTKQVLITKDSLSDTAKGYNLDNSATETESTPYLYAIPLKQNRRVRSGEVHYFDHPKMGMIIQIRKMTQPSTLSSGY
ncbi:peptidoglycan binding protein CsiV [Shewanella surugensis]|uniref:Peptidoglycan binding protein CsiV n=1 Tax=Shewanella surugensis TaxID=212020 RepID=A0ABT0L9F2_9GAMM|nr:peptidoglycan binding protein CsiV [Shewanella surugensis]MCL1124328.1 peptidoglycan binding protein CsiV [Shewanella surugensis]